MDPQALENELSRKLYEKRGNQAEYAVRTFLSLVASSTVVMVCMIFIFVAWQCFPVLLQETDNSRSGQMIPPDQIKTQTISQLAKFLEIGEDQVASLKPDVLEQLVESRNQELASTSTNPDNKINTTSWSKLIFPYQWSGSEYSAPVYVWQPTGQILKYNIVPLFLGSLKVSFVALLFSVPISLCSAIYVSQLAGGVIKEIVKPVIELLAGIPTVILGFLGWILISPWLAPIIRAVDPSSTPFNALIAGIALGLAVIPIIFTISEDALTAVPGIHRDAARALGASEWYSAISVVVPAALPGIFAAVVLGFGRAFGETMIVLLVSGNAASMDFSILKSSKTVTAVIAGEITDAPHFSDHYQILFLLGLILFIVTFFGNVLADVLLQSLRARMEGQLEQKDDKVLGSTVV